MKGIIGLILILAGIVLGLYLGVWVMFIGGIIQIINQIRAEHLEAMKVAIGIARVVLASFVGGISAYVFIIPGLALMGTYR